MTAAVLWALLFCQTHAGGPAAGDGVSLASGPDQVVLANADVRLAFARREGSLTSWVYRGRELLGNGGKGYVQLAHSKEFGRLAWRFELVRQSPELVEIAFVGDTSSWPFLVESHYILRGGEPGFHCYLVLGHDAAKHPGVFELAQYNYCLRIDPTLFTTSAVDDQRILPLPSPEQQKKGQMVMDATYRMADGTIYSKYFNSAQMDHRHIVHGAMGKELGVWVIMPSHEHLNGGPERQELTVHVDKTVVLLRHFTAAHYGGGILRSDSNNGSWRKSSATWFFYVNRGVEQDALWSDAKRRARQEVAQWPYRWLDDTQFELNRASVSGRLVFDDQSPVSGAQLILAPHENTPTELDWQRQWQGYRFYSTSDAEGRFSIPNVRSGDYDLYAWKPGVVGRFVQRKIHVDSGQRLDLAAATWILDRKRKLLWQIGIPDRSAAEFGFADNFRQWGLWDRIAAAYPGEVVYRVGRDGARQLPFLLAVTQTSEFAWRVPTWSIQFDDRGQRSGKAVLTLAIAAAEGGRRGPVLKIAINGRDLGPLDNFLVDGAAHRSGVFGTYQVREVAFDSAALVSGVNRLQLTLVPPARQVKSPLGHPAGGCVMFDCLRLELE